MNAPCIKTCEILPWKTGRATRHYNFRVIRVFRGTVLLKYAGEIHDTTAKSAEYAKEYLMVFEMYGVFRH